MLAFVSSAWLADEAKIETDQEEDEMDDRATAPERVPPSFFVDASWHPPITAAGPGAKGRQARVTCRGPGLSAGARPSCPLLQPVCLAQHCGLTARPITTDPSGPGTGRTKSSALACAGLVCDRVAAKIMCRCLGCCFRTGRERRSQKPDRPIMRHAEGRLRLAEHCWQIWLRR
jgi:hypothetical protein